MKKIKIVTDGAPQPVARYSQAIRVGDTLYVQGIIALDPRSGQLIDGGIGPQSERVFLSLQAILAEAGMAMADVVKVTAFLSDLNDYAVFNEIYGRWFAAEPPPVRTTVQARMPFDALVEVEVIAVA